MVAAAMRIRVRTLLANCALLAGSTLLVLVGAEVALRLFPDLMTEATQLQVHWYRSGDPRALVVPDPYIGYVYPPHGSAAQGRAESRFRYTLDEHGFRNPSPWPASADIVVLGDSWTFGYGVPDGDGWVALLSERFTASRVINLGLIGAAPEQYARVFERFGKALRPKLVVFGLFPGNDVHDTREFSRWLTNGGAVSYPEWRYNGGARWSWYDALRRRSYLLEFLGELFENRHLAFSGKTIDLGAEGRLRLVPSVTAKNASLAREDNPYFRHALAAVQQTREVAHAEGADFVVVLYPTKEEIYLPVIGEPAPDAISPFVTALAERGIPYIDLRPTMREHARAGERLYFTVDGHANDKGYRVIADAVATWIAGRAQVASTAKID